jgi:hypothetical protein
MDPIKNIRHQIKRVRPQNIDYLELLIDVVGIVFTMLLDLLWSCFHILVPAEKNQACGSLVCTPVALAW